MSEDIHNGIEAHDIEKKLILFSVGHRCTSASLIKELRLKFESYPFDWVVSKLDVILHCVKDDFFQYLNQDNYRELYSETFNLCDGEKIHICDEYISFNNFYETEFISDKEKTKEISIGTYGMKLAMTHHNICNERDKGYFDRCVSRFRKILALPQRKNFLYVHPLLGINQFEETSHLLLIYFIDFVENFKQYTTNSFGIFFICVKNEERKNQIETMFENEEMIVFVLYTNKNLIDGGGVYDGDFYNEQYTILTTIEKTLGIRNN